MLIIYNKTRFLKKPYCANCRRGFVFLLFEQLEKRIFKADCET